MTVDPDNELACQTKREWLQPKWYGTEDDAYDFGYQCYRTQNWHAGLPFMLEDPITRANLWSDNDYRSFYSPDITWQNTSAIYENYLKAYPSDRWAQSQFGYIAVRTNHWDEAKRMMEMLGENPWPSVFENRANFIELRIAAKVGKLSRAFLEIP